jgi:hypothetical protein
MLHLIAQGRENATGRVFSWWDNGKVTSVSPSEVTYDASMQPIGITPRPIEEDSNLTSWLNTGRFTLWKTPEVVSDFSE